MPLIQLWEKSPDIVLQYNIKQIVSAAGNGVLSDNSECSRELKHYLSNIPAEKLFEHIEYCLSSSFDKSGFVLQEIINELGRRLEYSVEGGLYQGRSNQIGYDGIWKSPDGHALVIEIKTTDVYRINLDTIATYRNKLIADNKITDKSSILIVVGRNDTGDLEAQIRGSRHAWDTRVISADALVKLVELKVKSGEEETTDKIRSLLVPFEYTRLDNIIDVLFTAAKDVETTNDAAELTDGKAGEQLEVYSQDHTSREILNNTRKNILESISNRDSAILIAHKRTQFSSSDKKVKVVCAVSKQYKGDGYWYIYHPRYSNFLREAERGYFALGCVGKDFGYAIPYYEMEKLLPLLNTTITPDSTKTYWHVHLNLNNEDGYDIVMKGGERISLEPYKICLLRAV